MEIKCKIKVTEGIVYNGIKEGVEAYLKVIRKALEQDGNAYKDTTGSLRHSMGYVHTTKRDTDKRRRYKNVPEQTDRRNRREIQRGCNYWRND